ncbi:MAG: hypothetical protein IT380_28105 [Myxococcales bacterium]|nr:hypothetical protein [Myxococcales bacterium]
MSELDAFEGPWGVTGIASAVRPSEVAGAWSALREAMVRELPDAFTRDEWAYLIQFLERGALLSFVEAAFGRFVGGRSAGFSRLATGRKTVTLVLPNNVSLLGPLMLAVATLSAERVFVKVGSRGDDVVQPFLDFAKRHAPPALKAVLARVDAQRLEREHPTLKSWLGASDVRVAFGSDAAVKAVEASAHPATSRFLGFGDMYSEAWLAGAVSDDVLDTLIKVFAIYGQAGCTSPRRVVLLDGTAGDLQPLGERLSARWPQVMRRQVPMHIASQNVLHAQVCRHAGVEVSLTPGHGAVLVRAPLATPVPSGPMTLVLSAAPLASAVKALPANIQTLGLSVGARLAEVVAAASQTNARRVVPLGRMHHFGPVWDGNLLPAVFFDVMECSA